MTPFLFLRVYYDLLFDEYIGFEMGVDFGINTYDEDFMVRVFHDEPSNSIDKIFKDAEVFNLLSDK